MAGRAGRSTSLWSGDRRRGRGDPFRMSSSALTSTKRRSLSGTRSAIGSRRDRFTSAGPVSHPERSLTVRTEYREIRSVFVFARVLQISMLQRFLARSCQQIWLNLLLSCRKTIFLLDRLEHFGYKECVSGTAFGPFEFPMESSHA